MIVLTEEETKICYDMYWNTNKSFKCAINRALELIASSPNRRIIQAPFGMRFVGEQVWRVPAGGTGDHILVKLEPNIKPCPPPMLGPVLRHVTVEEIYGFSPIIPTGWQAQFGEMAGLAAAGFTHFLAVDNVNSILPILLDNHTLRICLKKWEG